MSCNISEVIRADARIIVPKNIAPWITAPPPKKKKKFASLVTVPPDKYSIHDKNIQCLATEMYKVSNELSPPIVSNIFTQKNCHPYNLRLNSQFSRPLVKSVFHGTESISYLGPVIWDILPDSYKNLTKC